MAAALPADLAAALRYGVQTQQAVRRSKYLEDALKQLQTDGSKITGGYGELGAKLLATAILQRSNNKAKDATLEALKADRQNETSSLLGALRPPTMTPTPPQESIVPLPPEQTPIAALTPKAMPSVGSSPMAPVGMPQITPAIDKIVRTVWGEARSEPPEGQQGVAAVILNRANGRGLTPEQVVLQPKQFEPWGNPKTRAQMASLDPSSEQYQAILRNITPALNGQDPTGGADHFYSPTAQSALGRAPPAWDNGAGRDMGRHRFFDLEPNAQARPPEPAVPPPPPPPNPNGPDVQFAPQEMPQGQFPSAPGGSPPVAGGAAAGMPPQAQTPAAASPQWPTWKPSQEQVDYVAQLLNDPRYHDQGVQMAMQLREKMTQPAEAQIIQQNGVSFYVSKTPGQGGQPVMISIQPEAQTQTMAAQAAGLPNAPQGLFVQRDPMGNLKEAPGAPPQGYNAGSNGYQPIQGGPADPARVQAPPSGYQLNGPQGMAPISGSPADPRNPMNVLQGSQQIRSEIKTVVDQALQLKRNVDAVRTGFAQQNGPGDIAMVNGLQKLIDEGVVREGDVALQLKGQGIQGGIAGVQGYLTSEGFFADPKIRQGILNTANQLYGSLNDNYKARVMGYRPIADQTFGPGTFEQYVFPQETAQALGWGAQNTPPAPDPNLIDRSGRAPGWSGQLPAAQLDAARQFKGGEPGTAQNPYLVKTPEEARKYPPGSKILLPDGRVGTVPNR